MTKKTRPRKGALRPHPLARPAEPPESRPGVSVQMVDLDHLEANRQQPRRRFDDDGIEELARSIKETGILQPILVTRDGDRFRILAGERRVRAARLAGLTRVPVLVKEGLEDRDHLLVALIENVQRRDLTAMEEAESYWHLKDKFGMTQDEIAERVGKDRTTVSNAIRLLKLPAEIRAQVEDGLLSAGHARTLLALSVGRRPGDPRAGVPPPRPLGPGGRGAGPGVPRGGAEEEERPPPTATPTRGTPSSASSEPSGRRSRSGAGRRGARSASPSTRRSSSSASSSGSSEEAG